MRLEKSIEIDAPQERVWEVLSNRYMTFEAEGMKRAAESA